MKHFDSIHLSIMRNGVHFLFVKNVLEKAGGDPAVMEQADRLVSALGAAVDEEGKYFALSRKDFRTDDISRADKERDRLYARYRKGVSTFLDIPMPEEAEAARHLWQNLRDHNINPQHSLQQETGELLKLISDLDGPLAPHVATLGLTKLVARLKEANALANDMMLRRTDERSARKTGALRKARRTTDIAYDDLLRVIDAMAILHGTERYAPFISYVNTEIAQYKRNAMARTVAACTTEDKEDSGGATDVPSPAE